MSKEKTAASKRPLSPHLQVYKPQMTSVMSILHRATGVGLAIGTVILVWVLIAAATSESYYDYVVGLLSSSIGQLALIGLTFALFYHMCNGVRHLFWDMGYLFKLQNAFRAGWLVLASSVTLTVITWLCVYN